MTGFRANRQSGFTLLEMMVALVVFGLVMAGIAQTFKFGLAAWRQGPARTTEPENLAALDAALARIIGQTLPGTMTGDAHQVSFTTTLPPGAGLQQALADAALMTNGDDLILRYRPHPPGILLVAQPPAAFETLASGVDGFEISYLSNETGAPVWTRKWKGDRLPALLRLHINLADGRNWPDLIIAPATFGS